MINKIFNVGLRGATLASKFALLFVLAKYLEPSAVGLYGLIVVTVAYGMYPLGFEFYTYSAREVIKANNNLKGQFLKSQIAFHIVLYLFVTPTFCLIFYYGVLPWYVAPFFFVLLLTEHANQEFMRMLIAIQRPVAATFLLFIRHGSWAILVAFLFVFVPDTRDIKTVLIAWSIGGVIAFIIGVAKIKTTIKKGWDLPIDWAWVKRGVKIALPMFMGALSLNFITTADRYWFENLVSSDALGAYVFYMAITASAISFIEAGVFSFIYPAMIVSVGAGDKVQFNDLLSKMLLQAFVLSLFFATMILFFVDILLELISRPLYFELKYLLYPMLIMMIIQVLSYVPNYALYARNEDKPIVISNVLSVFVFFGSASFFVLWSEKIAISLALITVYMFLLLYKYYFYSKLE
tara:strand:+ start:1490 stop:2707 length:1218 start_codon:yes stop_codon:yes gene_type:complete